MKSAVALAKSKSRHPVNPKVPAFQARHSRAELAAMGKALRDKCLRISLASLNQLRKRTRRQSSDQTMISDSSTQAPPITASSRDAGVCSRVTQVANRVDFTLPLYY